ncbi:MAG: glycerophosphodiester phosphodiesterase, partial [Oligoflexia bacterium]|nr:glycerophosphodiester phosphodiesterase [Oligoflexia bacterium]
QGWTFSPAEFAQAIYKVLKEEKIVDRSEVQAFDFRCLQELRKLDSKIHLAYLTEADNEEDGPTNFRHPDPKVAGLWTAGNLLKDYDNSIPKMIKALAGSNPACWEPEDLQLKKETLDEAHQLGLKVVVWTWPEHAGTTFDYKLIDKLIDWGVDGIITDDPGHLTSMLAARGYEVPLRFILD